MARVEVPITVLNSSTGLPVSGAAVAISYRSGGAAAPWWAAETGGASSTSAIITDSSGRVNAWVNRGAYNLAVTGTGITPYTEPWDATPGSDASVDAVWLPDGSIPPAKFDAVSTSMLVPPGGIIAFAGSAAPTGFLLCDGAAVSRTTYSVLWGILGVVYGIGDGSTTFNVPDMRGRVPVGVDGVAGRLASSDTLGASGGAETFTILVTDVPGYNGASFSTGGSVPYKVSNTANVAANSINKMQPYQVINWIIKT